MVAGFGLACSTLSIAVASGFPGGDYSGMRGAAPNWQWRPVSNMRPMRPGEYSQPYRFGAPPAVVNRGRAAPYGPQGMGTPCYRMPGPGMYNPYRSRNGLSRGKIQRGGPRTPPKVAAVRYAPKRWQHEASAGRMMSGKPNRTGRASIPAAGSARYPAPHAGQWRFPQGGRYYGRHGAASANNAPNHGYVQRQRSGMWRSRPMRNAAMPGFQRGGVAARPDIRTWQWRSPTVQYAGSLPRHDRYAAWNGYRYRPMRNMNRGPRPPRYGYSHTMPRYVFRSIENGRGFPVMRQQRRGPQAYAPHYRKGSKAGYPFNRNIGQRGRRPAQWRYRQPGLDKLGHPVAQVDGVHLP